ARAFTLCIFHCNLDALLFRRSRADHRRQRQCANKKPASLSCHGRHYMAQESTGRRASSPVKSPCGRERLARRYRRSLARHLSSIVLLSEWQSAQRTTRVEGPFVLRVGKAGAPCLALLRDVGKLLSLLCVLCTASRPLRFKIFLRVLSGK